MCRPPSLDQLPLSASARPSSRRHAGRTELRLASEAIVAALADAGIDARRRRRPRQLHDRPGRGDRAGPLGRACRRSAAPARVPYGGGGSMGVLLHAAAAVAAGRRRRGRRLPGAAGPARAHVSAAPKSAGDDLGALGHHGDAVVHPYGVLTPASWMALNADALHAHIRRDQRRLRAGRRAAPGVRGDESRRLGLRAADRPRGPPGLALDRRAVHPHVRLLPGDRRLGRARHHRRRTRRRDCRNRRS